MKKQIYDIVFEAQYEGLTTKDATDKLLLLFSVSERSELLRAFAEHYNNYHYEMISERFIDEYIKNI